MSTIPDDLKKGIEGAELLMHARDFDNAYVAKTNYLGADLDNDGTKTIYKLASADEVLLGLNIVAKEMDPGFSLKEHHIKALQNPKQIEKLFQRFPAITPERIAAILA